MSVSLGYLQQFWLFPKTLGECRLQTSAKMNPAWIQSVDMDSGRLPKVNGFLVQRYVYGKIFMKTQSVFPEI